MHLFFYPNSCACSFCMSVMIASPIFHMRLPIMKLGTGSEYEGVKHGPLANFLCSHVRHRDGECVVSKPMLDREPNTTPSVNRAVAIAHACCELQTRALVWHEHRAQDCPDIGIDINPGTQTWKRSTVGQQGGPGGALADVQSSRFRLCGGPSTQTRLRHSRPPPPTPPSHPHLKSTPPSAKQPMHTPLLHARRRRIHCDSVAGRPQSG